MAKYSFEFKKKVVQAYLNGEGGKNYIAKKYGVTTESIVRKWVNAYKAFGDAGITRSRQQNNYTFEFKLSMVELYLTSEISYSELALQNGINNPSMLALWVKKFRMAGPDALRAKRKGRKSTMVKSKKTPKSKVVQNNPNMNDVSDVDTSVEHVKALERELLHLRIENAFLKELRRLRLEEEALQRKQRELYTVSEENSD